MLALVLVTAAELVYALDGCACACGYSNCARRRDMLCTPVADDEDERSVEARRDVLDVA